MLAFLGIRKLVAPLAAAALVWCLACSESGPVEPNPAMEEVYWLSDLQGQVETVVEYAYGALEPQREKFTEEQFSVAKQVIQEQFAAKNLTKKTLERLQAEKSPPFLEQTLAWLRMPTVRNVMKAKIATWSPAGLAGMKSAAEQRKSSVPSEKRLDLIERYDQAAGQSEVVQSTIETSGLAVAVMDNALRPAPEQQSIEALHASLSTRRNLIKPFFKEMSIVTSLVYFHDLSDDELEAFVTFSESEAGQWFYQTTSRAFLDSLREVAENIGPVFLTALQAQPSP